MNARAALFDLYGDHLRSRGGQASVAALVRLLAPLEIAAPAVRTAISRMVRQGWLDPVRLPQGPGYAATPKCVRRLDEAAARVYRSGTITWPGRWHLLVIEPVRERTRRERLRAHLSFLGYAPLSETTWIGPRASPELDQLDLHADRFEAVLDGDPVDLLARAWDLDAIGRAYEEWLAGARPLVDGLPGDAPDDQVFAVRSRLVHTWRNFLFRDPGLPAALLPSGWPGDKARAYFEQEASRLMPKAGAFVERTLIS
ncbi:PaaX family transcriptional regulator C-terminal domain-containing protein [Herbidospora sp. NBRC 101105]|uniref:PaaX family transcriptional regulator n=1 Tax=Herbidospora sp. NBRC 101105 TaxID=3032195 RepID=UPI0024A065BD|nr:PaaX family transcriptional regulator C-terminal domain-containing protein [Herbidospora sp. NBRC 101105]GLX98963.1 PaaX family transcriptional regulator [Herbidospora sp. NBRC 101105]